MRTMPRFVLALAGLLLALPVVGSAPVPPRAATPPVPLLWRVSDADSSVYLLGSFHLLKKSDYPLSRDVDRAFDDAESVVFEVSQADLEDASVAPRMMALATSDPAASLARAVPESVRAPLERRMRALGLSPEQMGAFEPWFVDVTLVTLLAQRSGYAPEDGLDRHLMARAAAAGKPTSGLETVQQQLATLDGTPLAEQVEQLREFVDEGDGAAAQLDELHRAWRSADVATIERLMRDEMMARTPVTYRRMAVDRNRAWVPQVERMLAQGRGHDALVVVGALHLIGPDGLVALLRARGYRVERMCSACGSKAR